MSQRVVYFNGEFVPESEARVSIFDSALMFGDMAFEMTRTFGGTSFRLREHLERLYASLKLMEIDCGLTIDEMESATEDTLERNRPTETDDVDWQIMHDVSRGPLPPYRCLFPDGLTPTVIINCWPLLTHTAPMAEAYDSGVNVVIVSQLALPAHLLDAKAKTRSRLHYRMAALQGGRSGDHTWPVMLDPDGFLAEGPGWNVLLVKNGELFSPEPRNILLGVSRDTTMQLAGKLGIPVHETNLGRYEALAADEILLTTTPASMLRAATFEGQMVGDGGPGPVYQKLMDAWKQEVGIDFVAQARDYAARLGQWEKDQQSGA